MMHNVGEVEDVTLVRDDGQEYLVLHTEKGPLDIRVTPTREGMAQLARLAERAKPGDNSFRADPPDEQADLTEASEGSDDGEETDPATVVTEVEIAPDVAPIEDDDPPLRYGEKYNPNDPREW